MALCVIFLLFGCLSCTGDANGSPWLHSRLTRALEASTTHLITNVTQCVDTPMCHRVDDVCNTQSADLLMKLCPLKCGMCECRDNPQYNCSVLLPGVCSSDIIASVCPATCGGCTETTRQVNTTTECTDLIKDIACADLETDNVCDDPLGQITCPAFCNLCTSGSPATQPPTQSSTMALTTHSTTLTMQDPLEMASSPTTEVSTTASMKPTTSTTAATTTPPPSTTTTPATTSVPAATACNMQPCINGGTCIPLPDFNFKCRCPDPTPPYTFLAPFCLKSQTQPITDASTTATTTTSPTSSATTTTTATTVPTVIAPTTPIPDICDSEQFTGCGRAEVVFMIAHTKYDSDAQIDHEIVYLMELIQEFKMDADHVRVGVVSYHDKVEEAIHITDYNNNVTGLLARVNTLKQNRYNALNQDLITPSGEPNVAGALDWVRKNAFKGARPGAKKVLVPIIHKLSILDYSLAIAGANAVKADCVQIFASSIDNFIWLGDVVSFIATNVYPPWYNYYKNFADLENGAKAFHNTQCQN